MNKKKLYKSIMESVSKELQNILLFNDSDIFNKVETLYNGPEIIDNYTYKTILEKLKNAELVSEKEYEYVHQSKYKVSSKKELKEIIENYSEKNSTGSLNWIDTYLITDMSNLFEAIIYNGDISEWDTSNVTNMESMFLDSYIFNLPIGNWDVSKVTNMNSMFLDSKRFNQSIGNWDVSNVLDMSFMFYGASRFNQFIGDWNVINVRDMNRMFCYAKAFNQYIGDWNISNVINMSYMFSSAISFNLNISNWKLNINIEDYNMFADSIIKKEYKPKKII